VVVHKHLLSVKELENLFLSVHNNEFTYMRFFYINDAFEESYGVVVYFHFYFPSMNILFFPLQTVLPNDFLFLKSMDTKYTI